MSEVRRPFLSISRVRLLGPAIAFGLFCILVVPLLDLGWGRHDVRWAIVGLGSITLASAAFRCPRCFAGVALRSRDDYTTRCRKCGLDLERNTYWGRPFVGRDLRDGA